MDGDMGGPPVRILYHNWRGETAWRRIQPLWPWFGSTQWHPEPQYLWHAYDLDKQQFRDFAVKDIRAWVQEDDMTRKAR